jgi:hypothetical protein
LRCCWKGNVLLSTHAKASRKKGRWSTINLTPMTKMIRPNSLNRLLRQWSLSTWIWHHQKSLGKKFVYELMVFLSYQRILDLKGVWTFKGGNSQKNNIKYGIMWRWNMEVCIIKNMMGVAQNNELKFQRLLEHHPLWEAGPHVEHPLTLHFWWKMMWKLRCLIKPPRFKFLLTGYWSLVASQRATMLCIYEVG